jgi:small-conductance mechanosensitive channel
MFDSAFWTGLLGRLAEDIADWMPNVAGALALLLAGWVAARLAQAFLGGLLRRLGFDRLAHRAGAGDVLKGAGLESSVSGLIARVVYWIVLLAFILAAARNMGLSGVAATMEGIVAYLPKVLAAGLILMIGGLIARIVGEAVGALAANSGAQSGPALGQATRYVLLIFAAILALDQLGVQTPLLTAAAIAVIGATALGLAMAFGLGSRELARNIMAGFHAKDEFTPGQNLNVRNHTGRLVAIGTVKSVIETESGRVSLPNSVLTDEEVTIAPDTDRT